MIEVGNWSTGDNVGHLPIPDDFTFMGTNLRFVNGPPDREWPRSKGDQTEQPGVDCSGAQKADSPACARSSRRRRKGRAIQLYYEPYHFCLSLSLYRNAQHISYSAR